MNVRLVSMLGFSTALIISGTGIGLHKVYAAPTGPSEFEDGMQVLTRGPVHEAFAETVTFDPEPGIVVRKAPPEPIEEVPPEQRPEGTNVVWIPGYWGWDDERSDFLWVSGIWRDLPPGRQWVPGYWAESGEAFQWTSGYWADAASSEIEYLPEPPATVEAGPNIAAPSADHLWVPGCWVWNQGRYAWQPGYWAMAQPDWSWIPAHYVWAPSGYVFVDGYYDYSVERRGVLFAPIYFDSSVYSQSGFSYSPATVINPAVFASQLFLRPHFQHYYFGDYYGANYSSAGYHPWFSYNSSRFGYDPIYAQQRWQHRDDDAWEQKVHADFQHRRDHEDARPPRTWADQTALMAREANSKQKSFVVAAPLDQLAKSKESPLRFQAVDRQERQRLAKHGQEIQKFRQERQKLETRGGRPTADLAKQAEPARVKLSRSPIFAKPVDELGKDHVPPQAHVTPPLDLKFEPKPRVARSSQLPLPNTTNSTPFDTARPQSGGQPRPKVVDRPNPQPQSRVNQPPRQTTLNRPDPQPQPRVNQPQPQLKVNRPTSESQPQPRINQPSRQTTVNRPAPQPQPRTNQPQPQPQPRVNQPQQPQPQQPQPRVNQPQPQQPQPRVNQPQPQQPQPR